MDDLARLRVATLTAGELWDFIGDLRGETIIAELDVMTRQKAYALGWIEAREKMREFISEKAHERMWGK